MNLPVNCASKMVKWPDGGIQQPINPGFRTLSQETQEFMSQATLRPGPHKQNKKKTEKKKNMLNVYAFHQIL